jgi:hypothetical protein
MHDKDFMTAEVTIRYRVCERRKPDARAHAQTMAEQELQSRFNHATHAAFMDMFKRFLPPGLTITVLTDDGSSAVLHGEEVT